MGSRHLPLSPPSLRQGRRGVRREVCRARLRRQRQFGGRNQLLCLLHRPQPEPSARDRRLRARRHERGDLHQPRRHGQLQRGRHGRGGRSLRREVGVPVCELLLWVACDRRHGDEPRLRGDAGALRDAGLGLPASSPVHRLGRVLDEHRHVEGQHPPRLVRGRHRRSRHRRRLGGSSVADPAHGRPAAGRHGLRRARHLRLGSV